MAALLATIGSQLITTEPNQKSARRPIGIFGWCLRLLGALSAVLSVCFLGLVSYYFIVVAPRERAAQEAVSREAETFKRLSGKDRRLAIYDAFVTQIDQHYFDQKFEGVEWPKLRSSWRIKAALAPDDWHLYWDVLLQVALKFPTSHVSVSMPRRPLAPETSALAASPGRLERCSDYAAGMQVVPIRRGKGVTLIVGEVLPGSPAAEAGVVPGWAVLKFSERFGRPTGRMTASLLRLTPDQRRALEATGSTSFTSANANISAANSGAYLASLKTQISFNFACKNAPPAFEIRMLPSGVRYIRFDEFEPALIDKVLEALSQSGNMGAVLDLRFNRGGYPLLLLNSLLPTGTPVYRLMDARGVHVTSTDRGRINYRGPLAILTGPSSASAAEISSAVLKTMHRAIVVGRRTNGSVLGAGFFSLPDGGQVEVPVQDLRLLDGTRLEGRGVAPDIEVYPTIEQIQSGQDPALLMAIHALRMH